MKAKDLADIVQALNSAEARYIIVGGLAVNAYGYLRYTNDVDLVLQLERSNILRGLEALARLGYRSKQPVSADHFADGTRREQWTTEKGMVVFPLWCDPRIETPIDIFVREPFDFEQEWRRVPRQEVAEGVPANFVSLPALFELKRQAGRPQDLADISQIRLVHDLPPKHE